MEIFKHLGLKNEVLRAIEEIGFKEPTPVQQKTIPHLLQNQGQDLIALAQTGTGKTAGFGLPIINLTDTAKTQTQALILCPTRELCLQIAKDLKSYAKYINNLKITAVYGGTNISEQIRELRKGSHIVVGTPGRTLDLISRSALKVQHIRWMVMDEADEMLNMGFKDELDAILATTPESKNTLLFSATMPQDVKRIANEYMSDAAEITVGDRNKGADTVTHLCYTLREADRYLALKRLADLNPDIYGIVFCRTRRETKEVAEQLMNDRYNADTLHGDLSQAQRDYVMQRFRSKSLQILVATDVAARGLDVNELTHVINYKLPDDPEVYIHRSGRTGRAGKTGVSIALINGREKRKIQAIENMMKKPFKQASIPTGREVCESQLLSLVSKLSEVEVNSKEIEAFLPAVRKKLEHLNREELIKKIVSIEFNHFLNYYKNAKDLNIYEKEGKKNSKKEGNKKTAERFNTLSINLGRKHNINPSYLIGIINELTGNHAIPIGRIDVQEKGAFLDVDSQHVNDVIQACFGIMYNNVKLQVKDLGKSKGEAKARGKNQEKYKERPSRKAKPSGKERRKQQGRKGRRNGN